MQISDISSFLSPSQTLQKPAQNATNKELMKASQEFEAIFIGQLYKEMKKSVSNINKDSQLFKTSMGEDIFKDMLFDQYAIDSATHSSLGLAQMVYDSLSKGR